MTPIRSQSTIWCFRDRGGLAAATRPSHPLVFRVRKRRPKDSFMRVLILFLVTRPVFWQGGQSARNSITDGKSPSKTAQNGAGATYDSDLFLVA